MFTRRQLIISALFSIAVLLGTFSFRSFATPMPSATGTLSPGNPEIHYTDGPLVTNETGLLGPPDCTVPNSCSDFTLTVNAASVSATKQILIQGTWTPTQNDFDMFILNASGTIEVAQNASTSNPSAVILPIPADGTVYHIVIVASVGTGTLDALVKLIDKPASFNQGPGPFPRYMNYPAGSNQSNDAGEPSIGVDWNPNVPSLKNVEPPTKLNTGGVAFFTSNSTQWRSSFDDCSSPALNLWEDMNAPVVTGLDPIGFVDHYLAGQLGLSYPPPHTQGRVFGVQLAAGDSTAAYSDDDGTTWTPLSVGGAGQGPDHETLGGGPFHTPIPTPPAPAYPNAIYYCSQSLFEAECSRSDDGGITYASGVPIFNPSICGGGIHGHVKVSPQGTVYVPNESCFTGNGSTGVARSTDNGITWAEFNVPGSQGDQDPSVGIGQNNIGKPASQVANTVYLAWIEADGHAHAAHSGDEGATWQDNIDISSILGVQSACFPVMVAGDDNRAAIGFIGTTTPGAGAFSDPNFPGVWHLYIAHTYDGGQTWNLIDATPLDPVQKGEICLGGQSCTSANRGLLDFNDFGVDAEGRGLLAYADGCVNCNNTFDRQSQASHGTIARQSGGKRLFAAFDPVEPAPPAAPRVLTAVRVAGPPAGVLVSWVTPDNGGSPITGYNVYRGTSSGGEGTTPIAFVSGVDTNKYLDTSADASSNYFYRVTAVNTIAEGAYCREVSITATSAAATACLKPYIQVAGAGTFAPAPTPVPADPTNGELTIEHVSFGEPFSACSDNSITFVMKVKTLDPSATGHPVLPANAIWQMTFKVKDTSNRDQQVFVEMNTTGSTPTAQFAYGREDTDPNPAVGTFDTTVCSTDPALAALGCSTGISGSYTPDGTITIKLDVGTIFHFNAALGVTGAVAFDWDARQPGTILNPPPATVYNTLPLPSSSGTTWLFVGVAGNGTTQPIQITSGVPYTRVGNVPGCNTTPPMAILSANPLSGPASTNFNFDGRASFEPVGACGTINSYTINFGDGSPPASNTTGTFNHIYSAAGSYPALLTATNSLGLTSTNLAKVVITVNGVPPLNGVVSRKTHIALNPPPTGPGDLVLNSDPAASTTVEPRAGGIPSGNHTLVFSFVNALNTVSSVTATATTSGGVQTIPAQNITKTVNGNFCTIDLTAVPNASHLSVTLHGVTDSQLNSGDITQKMDVLYGDVNGNGVLTNADVSLVKAQVAAGGNVTQSNIQDDVNVNGVITNADVSIVKGQVAAGAQLPPSP